MTKQELELQEKELLKLLGENRDAQRDISKNEFVQKHGFYIGDTVEFVDGKKIFRGVISSIDFSGVVAQMYIATLLNSDGKLGKRNTRIWYSAMPTIKLISKAETN